MKMLMGALVTLSLAAGCASTRNSQNPMTTQAAPTLSDAKPALGGPRSVTGMVQGYTHAPGGQVDGVYLADGNRVHVPPTLGDKLAVVAPVGMTISAQGREMRDPQGRVSIEADRVTNTTSNGTLDVASSTIPANGMGGSGTGQPPPPADPGVPPPPPVTH